MNPTSAKVLAVALTGAASRLVAGHASGTTGKFMRSFVALCLLVLAVPCLAADDAPVSEVDPDVAAANRKAAYETVLTRLDAIARTRPEALKTRDEFVQAEQLWEQYTTQLCHAEASLNRFKGSRRGAFEAILQMQCRAVLEQIHADHLNNYIERILPEA